jgi:hypothetical protein
MSHRARRGAAVAEFLGSAGRYWVMLAGVVMVLVFAVPLLCWALAARTARTGWIVAAVLAVCVAAEIVLAEGWLLGGERFTLVVTFALVTVAALVVGISTEWDLPGVRKIRRSGLKGATRVVTGLTLSVAYCGVCLIAIVFVVIEILMNGLPASVPSGAGVLPLPAGLVLAANTDAGCSSGSATVCDRYIQVAGSAPGEPGSQVMSRVYAQLTRVRGWDLTSDGDGGWSGCRTIGLLLDRHQECVSVDPGPAGATITLETSDNW